MIAPIQRSKTIAVDVPLPPSWVRRNPTKDDSEDTTSARLWRVGPRGVFLGQLVEAIERASEVILVASFLLADQRLCDALLAASERKVRVYVLTASENRLREPNDGEDSFDARMVAEHKRLLDSMAGKLLLRSASHFHAKFLLVDPHRPSARGWLSTANFNKALTTSVELGLALDEAAIEQVAEWFMWAFWTEAEHELEGPNRLAAVRKPPASPSEPTRASVFATTKRHQQIRSKMLEIIAAARREIWVASYGLAVDHEVVRALIERAKAGVKVTVLTRPRPAVAQAVQALAAAGAHVLAHDKLHAKAIWSDAGSLVTTANLERHGLDEGFELAVRVSGSIEAALRQTLEDWSRAFPWAFEPSALPRVGEIIAVDKGLRDVQKVKQTQEVVLKAVEVDDVRELDRAPEPELVPPQGQVLAAELHYMWTVKAAQLPRGAKPVLETVESTVAGKKGEPKRVETKRAYDPPVYELAGQRYVAIQSLDQLGPAQALARQFRARIVVV